MGKPVERFGFGQASNPCKKGPDPMITASHQEVPHWRIDRSGQHESYLVSGWRYSELPVWHITMQQPNKGKQGQSYLVVAGEFYPDSVSRAEREAVLHLIADWETEGRKQL